MPITAESLGSPRFRSDYGLRYAYLAGAMYKGISSTRLVVAMGRAGMLGFLGTGGMTPAQITAAIRTIQAQLDDGEAYGMNLLCNLNLPELEERTVDLFIEQGVRNVEAAAFMRITPSLVRWRLTGIKPGVDGRIERPRRILAKISRPEVAAAFMQPPPESMVRELVAARKITAQQAQYSRLIPMADEICVEADSGGHTDQGVAYALTPTIQALRDEMMARYGYDDPIMVGAAGGIGTPQAAAAAFILGADFILTGSINQCTVEAGTSDVVKDILESLDVQDTDYAPAGDMFEIGARVQVARRGLLFAARANNLYQLYQRCRSIEEIDANTRRNIEEKYFRRSFEAVWDETRAYYLRSNYQEVNEAERSPKHKMALIFRWYFVHSTRLAMQGSAEQKVDYQIHCGPAMGAFNQWVRATELRSWRKRFVADIGTKLMLATADVLNERFAAMSRSASSQRVASL